MRAKLQADPVSSGAEAALKLNRLLGMVADFGMTLEGCA